MLACPATRKDSELVVGEFNDSHGCLLCVTFLAMGEVFIVQYCAEFKSDRKIGLEHLYCTRPVLFHTDTKAAEPLPRRVADALNSKKRRSALQFLQ